FWLYDNDYRPVAQIDDQGNYQHFVYANNAHVPLYMVVNGQQYVLVTDYFGSVRFVVNANSGAVEQALDYDAWGNITLDTNPGFQPFAFAGGMLDPDTGLMLMGMRDYDPRSGRFVSIDPAGLAGGENFWLYTDNNPISRIDPTGEYWVYVVGAIAVGGLYVAYVGNTAMSSAEPANKVSKNLGIGNGPADALRHCIM